MPNDRSSPALDRYEQGSSTLMDGGEPVDDARAVVVGRLRARQDELVGAIFARVRGDAFPAVGADDAEYVAGLCAAVSAAVEYVLEGIERGRDGVAPTPVVLCEQARRAARAGVSLDTVLRRYVVGHSLLEAVIMEAPARGESDLVASTQREALREALRSQASMLDRLLVTITGEYRDELAHVRRSPEQRRAELVRGLLNGDVVDLSGLDYELDGWHLGMIAAGAGAPRVIRDLTVGVDRRRLSVGRGRESVWAWLGGGERFTPSEIEGVLASARLAEAMAGETAVADGGVLLALGEPARGIEGWRLTHRQAQAALVVALRRHPRRLTRYAGVALLASALKDEALARTLIDTCITPLDDSRGSGPVLRQTLRAYLGAERSVSSAAAALGVARKTVESRLRTIEKRLGRTLHPAAAEIQVALELDELAAVPPLPPEISIVG
jgi:PucR C-terminal helix-turn-helix domain